MDECSQPNLSAAIDHATGRVNPDAYAALVAEADKLLAEADKLLAEADKLLGDLQRAADEARA